MTDEPKENTATGSDMTPLATVGIEAGQARPFCRVTWRSLYADEQGGGYVFTDPDGVVDRTFGLRSLILSAGTIPYGKDDKNGAQATKVPKVLRLVARPRRSTADFTFDDTAPVSAKFVESRELADVLVEPARDWGDGTQRQIDVPVLRLSAGELRGVLVIPASPSANTLFHRLSYRRGGNSLFGAFSLPDQPPGQRQFVCAVTPQGLEFDARVPDPLRGTGEAGSIAARFRLEAAPAGGYWVRLIGRSETAAAESEKDLARVTTRLAALLTHPSSEGAPALFRLDPRAGVPPLIFPLVAAPGTKALSVEITTGQDCIVEIDPSAVDLRLATASKHQQARDGLARIHAGRIALVRDAQKLELSVTAGTGGGPQGEIVFTYTRDPDAAPPARYPLSLSATSLRDVAVAAPLEPLIARLRDAYVASGALSPDRDPPYAFFALEEGWLQWPLPAAAARSGKKADAARAPAAASAMTGRIVGMPDEGAGDAVRGVVVDEATTVKVTLNWNLSGDWIATPSPTEVKVGVGGGAGRFLGFLFVADTGPTASEAIPGWSAGDGAVREMPLWFGTEPDDRVMPGKFTWQARDWSLDLDVASKETPVLGWTPLDRYPLITNFTLTRSAMSAPEPSFSQGLVPRVLSGPFRLRYGADPTTGNELPALVDRDNKPGVGVPFEADQTVEGGRPRQSLLMPALMGVEFTWTAHAGSVAYTAYPRYDLPALDDYFAWSDPPPPETSQALAATPITEPGPPAPFVTALDPMALARLWVENRARLRLTWTADAAVGTPVPVDAAGATRVSFNALAAPWSYVDKNVEVRFRDTGFLGAISIAGQPDGLAGALAGIGGAVAEGDPPLALQIDGGALVGSDKGPIFVTGNAVDLYAQDSGLMVDARGTGLTVRPDPEGLRSVRRFADANGTLLEYRLFTLDRPETITVAHPAGTFRPAESAGMIEVELFLRDLPLTADSYTFDGAGNPIEGRRAQTGQGFAGENFPLSLYEWRFYAPGASPRGQYSIPFGPFNFRPLRLLEAVADAAGTLARFTVLGSVGLSSVGSSEQAGEFAFGHDDVYGRRDLFTWTFVRGEGWTLTQQAVECDGTSGPALMLRDRQRPTIAVRPRLRPAPGNALLVSDAAVDAPLIVDIATGEATLKGTLFGNADAELQGRIERVSDRSLRFAFTGLGAKLPAGRVAALENVSLFVTLSMADGRDTLDHTGELVVHGPQDNGAALRLSDTEIRWLQLTIARPTGVRLHIDHRRGTVRLAQAEPGPLATLDQPATPLFKFEFDKGSALDLAFAGVLARGAGTELGFATAFAQVNLQGGPDRRLRHEVMLRHAQDGDSSNALWITWRGDEVKSCVRWPVGGMSLDGSEDRLRAVSAGPLVPDPIARGGETQFGILTVGAEAPLLEHWVIPCWNAHRIDLADLRWSADQAALLPAVPIRLQALVSHRLENTATRESAVFDTLDHITLTTPKLIAHEVEALTFAPRDERKSRTDPKSTPLRYRGTAITQSGAVGVAKGINANLAGVHDAAAVKWLWREAQDRLVVVGNAPLILPFERVGTKEKVARFLMLPWILDDKIGKLQVPGSVARTWRLPLADIWAGHAMADTHRGAVIGLNRAMTHAALETRATGRDRGASAVIPVEQGLFEPFADGNPAALTQDAFLAAPLFPRAMIALYLHWQEMTDPHWRAVSLVMPDLPQDGGATGQPPRLQRALVSTLVRPTAGQVAGARARLVILGAERVISAELERPMAEGVGDAGLIGVAELRELAELQLHDALLAMRIADAPGERPETLTHPVAAGFDPLARAGATLTEPGQDIGASPALGWPQAPVGGQRSLAGVLGPEYALQSPGSGFSGRSQRSYWAARAYPESRPDAEVAAHGTAFATRIDFDRGATPFPFDGPAGRHLLVHPVRQHSPGVSSGVADLAPLSTPVIDRTVIGVRAGVMYSFTTAVKQTPGGAALLDPGWPDLGRPADGGPVLAHQLRMPRSVVLPPDPTAQTLEHLRRRTYLSRADVDEGAASAKVLTLFRAWDGPADVLRVEGADGSMRVVARLPGESAPRLEVGTQWDGRLILLLEGVRDGGEADVAAALGIHVGTAGATILARFRIADEVVTASAVEVVTEVKSKLRLTCVFALSASLIAAVVAATGSTRMVLDLSFPVSPAAVGPLLAAPVRMLSLPVLRAAEGRRVVATRTTTIAFGDPAYDRSLASKALIAAPDLRIKGIKGLVRFAADRTEYNPDGTLFLAFGRLSADTGSFVPLGSKPSSATVSFSVDRARTNGDTTVALPVPMGLRGVGRDLANVTIPECAAFGVRLPDLVGRDKAGLATGDTLIVKAQIGEDAVEMRARIVARPVIAPPAAVYTLVEIMGPDDRAPARWHEHARTRAHARSALPTRLEFPDLLKDLAAGHVRRRALFVWSYTLPRTLGTGPVIGRELIKLDVSGGAQLPLVQAPQASPKRRGKGTRKPRAPRTGRGKRP